MRNKCGICGTVNDTNVCKTCGMCLYDDAIANRTLAEPDGEMLEKMYGAAGEDGEYSQEKVQKSTLRTASIIIIILALLLPICIYVLTGGDGSSDHRLAEQGNDLLICADY